MNSVMQIPVDPRFLRLETYHALVQHHYGLLSTAFNELTMRPQHELLSKAESCLQRKVNQMEHSRTSLIARLVWYAPGEECTLTQLINYATVAAYQYNLILEAKRRNCSHFFFDWASQYRQLVNRGSLPCKLVDIPPIGYEYDFMCKWLQPSEYVTLYRFFYFHITNYLVTIQRPNSP